MMSWYYFSSFALYWIYQIVFPHSPPPLSLLQPVTPRPPLPSRTQRLSISPSPVLCHLRGITSRLTRPSVAQRTDVWLTAFLDGPPMTHPMTRHRVRGRHVQPHTGRTCALGPCRRLGGGGGTKHAGQFAIIRCLACGASFMLNPRMVRLGTGGQ